MSINKNYCGAIVALAIGIAILLIKFNHTENNNKLSRLADATFEVTFADEDLINDCAAAKDNKAIIHNDVVKLRTALGNLVKAEYAAGSLISQDTFCKLLAFNIFNDELQLADHNACTNKNLMNTARKDTIKRDLLVAINKDNLNQDGVFKSISSLLSNPALYKYPRGVCHLD